MAKEKLHCAITGHEHPRRELVSLETLNSTLETQIMADHPGLDPTAMISRSELARYRARYVEDLLKAEKGELTQLDRQVANSMATQETLAENTSDEFEGQRTIGERCADRLAAFGGSWTFILSFFAVLVTWMIVNALLPKQQQFDVYP